jgi:hypothetical protein
MARTPEQIDVLVWALDYDTAVRALVAAVQAGTWDDLHSLAAKVEAYL